jgi:hypothetical protein
MALVWRRTMPFYPHGQSVWKSGCGTEHIVSVCCVLSTPKLCNSKTKNAANIFRPLKP